MTRHDIISPGYLATADAGTREDRQWTGIYDAQVANTNDPQKLGRIQLYVPQVLGNTTSAWASPMQPGLTPAVGQPCFCHFLGGNPDLPQFFIGLTSQDIQAISTNTGLVQNPNPYFTGNVIVPWTATNGTVAAIQPNPDTNPPFVYGIQLTSAGPGGSLINQSTSPIAAGPLQPYQVTGWVYYPLGGNVTLGMTFQGVTHNTLSTVSNTVSVPAGVWTELTAVVNSPASTAFGYPVIGPATSTAGQQFTAQAVQVIGGIPGSLVQPGTITNTQLNSSITARSIGGIVTTISSTTPVGPVIGDIWIDSANGYQLQQYNGTTFVPITFNGTDVLQAGTITASLIAAHTITAQQIAAGTIISGIVDATTINAATLTSSTILGYAVSTLRGPYDQSFEDLPIQIATATGTGTSLSFTLPQATGSGNCLIACIATSHPTITSVTLGGVADHWASAASVADAGTNNYYIYTDQNAAAGQSAIKINLSASSTAVSVILFEFANVNLSSAVDKTATGNGASTGTFTTSTTATTTQANELVIGMAGMFAGSAPVITETVFNDTTTSWGGVGTLIAGFLPMTATGTQVYTGTMAPNATDYGALVVTLKISQNVFSWTGQNATLSQSTTFSSDGNLSLLITANGSGQPGATSPYFATVFNDVISYSVDVFAPVTVNNVTAKVSYFDSNHTLLGSTSDPTSPNVITGGAPVTTLTILDTVSFSNAAFFNLQLFDAHTDAVNTLIYIDNIQSAGNITYSLASSPDSDSVGNAYSQGSTVVSVQGLTTAYAVVDPFGNTLSTMDGSGNFSGQTISAATDVLLAGNSLLNTTLPTFSAGVINSGYIPSGSIPFPSTPIGNTKVAMLELDATVPTDRSCKFVCESSVITINNGGDVFYYLYYTTDGSTPSTSSTLATQECSAGNDSLNTGFTCHPGFTWYFNTLGNGSDTVYKFLLVGFTNGTSTTFQLKTPMQVTIEDVGLATLQNTAQNANILGSGSSGGNSQQTYTKQYYPVHTYTYSSGGVLRNTDGPLNEGSSAGHFFFLDYSSGNTMSSDLSGATINYCKLYVHNTFSYFSRGCNLELWANSHGHTGNYNSGRVTLGTPACGSGQSVRISLSTTVASNLASGTYKSFQVGPGPGGNNAFNASFQGPSGPQQPFFLVNYTK